MLSPSHRVGREVRQQHEEKNRIRGVRRTDDGAGGQRAQSCRRHARSWFRGRSRWRSHAAPWLRGAPLRRTWLRRAPLRGPRLRQASFRGTWLPIRACLSILRTVLLAVWCGSELLVLLPKLRRVLPERNELSGGVGNGTG